MVKQWKKGKMNETIALGAIQLVQIVESNLFKAADVQKLLVYSIVIY